jgi:thiamine pyrophosphate-dependent acetolactate synthase large subunit-like protein
LVLVADAIGRALARQGTRHVFGLIGSGNFQVSNALVAVVCASWRRATKVARFRWPMRMRR